MELSQLRTFRVVAETLNFTRAAERLGLTQSAVSHQIKSLETELGEPLFIRAKRGVKLSSAGQAALEHAVRLLAHELLEERREQVDDGLGGGSGPHPSGRRVLAAGDALAERLRLVEQADGVLERGLPRRGQLHAALGADEQRLTELGLQRLDLVAHRRLGEPQPLGRAREVQRLRDDPEGSKLRKLHALSPLPSRRIMNDSGGIKRITRIGPIRA